MCNSDSKRCLHAIEVTSIQIRTLRIIHPRALAVVLRGLRKRPYPVIEICSDFGHLLVELGSLGG